MRVCELKQARVEETIVEWDESRSGKYRGVGAAMMASATNLWTVEAHGEQTLVTTTAEATMKGGPIGVVLELLSQAPIRTARSSVAGLPQILRRARQPVPWAHARPRAGARRLLISSHHEGPGGHSAARGAL